MPESDAKGRNSTAVSKAQLTPTMGFCQEKGRGKGETTTISICLGPERLLNQRKICFTQGHANRSQQAEPRSSSRLLAWRCAGTTAQARRCSLAVLPAPDLLYPFSLSCHTKQACPSVRPLATWEWHRHELHASTSPALAHPAQRVKGFTGTSTPLLPSSCDAPVGAVDGHGVRMHTPMPSLPVSTQSTYLLHTSET